MPLPGETLTANYHWTKPFVTGSTSTWGGTLNDDLDAIDAALFSVANPASLTASSTPGTGVEGTLTFANSSAPTGQKIRWVWGLDTSPEGGGNAGSNLSLAAYSDGGAPISTPLSFIRATGAATFGAALTVTGAATLSGTSAFTGAATFNGAATFAGAATFSAAATFAGGVAGVTDGSSALAGQVGEYLTAALPQASAIALNTSGAVSNVISMVLSPGDWDVWGALNINGAGTAATLNGGVSTTSATAPSNPFAAALEGMNGAQFAVPMVRVSSASSTTVYLVASASGATGNPKAFGTIQARRAR